MSVWRYALLVAHARKPPHHNHFTALFWEHPGEPVPEENFWKKACQKRRRLFLERWKSKSFPSHIGPKGGTDLSFCSRYLDLGICCETMDTELGHLMLCLFSVYTPTFAGSHCVLLG